MGEEAGRLHRCHAIALVVAALLAMSSSVAAQAVPGFKAGPSLPGGALPLPSAPPPGVGAPQAAPANGLGMPPILAAGPAPDPPSLAPPEDPQATTPDLPSSVPRSLRDVLAPVRGVNGAANPFVAALAEPARPAAAMGLTMARGAGAAAGLSDCGALASAPVAEAGAPRLPVDVAFRCMFPRGPSPAPDAGGAATGLAAAEGAGGASSHEVPGEPTLPHRSPIGSSLPAGAVAGGVARGPALHAEGAAAGLVAPPTSPLLAVAAALVLALAVALYRRLTQRGVHGQEVRTLLLAEVRKRPGITLATLARATCLHASTVRYHAQLLQEFHLVVLQPFGRSVRIFENGGSFRPEERLRLAAAAMPGNARLLTALPPEGAKASDLARLAGVSRQAVHKQLPRLAAAGLVVLEDRQHGRWVRPLP